MYSEMVEKDIAGIAASVPEPSELDALPDKIPATPVPGLPEKLAKFSRPTAKGQQFFTDSQVLACLVREGKANQRRVDHWKEFIKECGVLLLGLYLFSY
jgi:hypothetical protein